MKYKPKPALPLCGFGLFGCTFLAGLLAGCAEETFSYDPADGFQHIPYSEDAADCTASQQCQNRIDDDRDTYFTPFSGNLAADKQFPNGYYGYIDNKCHPRPMDNRCLGPISNNAPDFDYIKFHAESGTPLHVTVTRANSDQKLRPVIYLLDEEGRELIYSHTLNSDTANLWFRAPSKTFYVSIIEARNYRILQDADENQTDIICKKGTYYGGKDYGYAVFVENVDANRLLYTFGAIANTKQWSGGFTLPGEALYFNARLPEGKNLKIRLTNSSTNPESWPVISPINGSKGDYTWEYTGDTLMKTYDENKQFAELTISSDLVDQNGFINFAITDYNSEAGYKFKLAVTPVNPIL